MREKTQDELKLQAYHRIRSRLVSKRTATVNQIRAFLIEQGIAVRPGLRALRVVLFEILKNRADEISPRMADLIVGLYEDWLWLDERIETVTVGIENIAAEQAACRRLMSVPGLGSIIFTAMVAAVGDGEAEGRRVVGGEEKPTASLPWGASRNRATAISGRCSSKRPRSSSCDLITGTSSASALGLRAPRPACTRTSSPRRWPTSSPASADTRSGKW